MTRPTTSILIEIPEALWLCAQDFLVAHPEWDQERILTAALALWLVQNGGDRRANKIYLDSLFSKTNDPTT